MLPEQPGLAPRGSPAPSKGCPCPGHNSWPVLHLFVLWVFEAQKKNKWVSRHSHSFLTLSWYLTREVFNLEKIHLFKAQNWRLFQFLLSCFVLCQVVI